MKLLRLSMAKNATRKKKTDAKGFTLMEVLAALLLTALVLPAVLKGVSFASMLVSDSDHKYQALELAETKLAEVLLEESWKTGGSASGYFDDEYEDYEWAVDTSGWTEAGVKQVDVVVTWQQRNRPRELRVSTLVYNAD